MSRRPGGLDPDERPARKDPPKTLKATIYTRQAGRCHLTGVRLPTIWDCEWHHIPPLSIRPVRPDGRDYEPGQLDPDYLFAVHPRAHKASTDGPDVEKRHLLRPTSDKSKAKRTRDLRTSYKEHLEAMANKEPGKPRQTRGRWPRRPFR
jgi:hypothetical protein